MVRDAQGNLYGTTEEGGPIGAGVVYEITGDGKEKILHSFCSGDCLDGAYPNGLIMDAEGNLYGTAAAAAPTATARFSRSLFSPPTPNDPNTCHSGGLAHAFPTHKSGCPALLAFFARDSLLPVKQFFLWREGRKGRV